MAARSAGDSKHKLYAKAAAPVQRNDGNEAGSDRRTEKRRVGDQAEQLALAYLNKAGLVLVQRNFLCRGGEIDLIMRDAETLVFVEVRSRASDSFGGALASITPAKQRRLQHAAQVYLMRLKALPACRFDALLLEAGKIQWLKNIIS